MQGDEERLVDCPHARQDDCGSVEAAGVICDFGGEQNFWTFFIVPGSEEEAVLSSEGHIMFIGDDGKIF